MPNRAERRAQAKAGRRGVPSQYDQTHGRGRSGMIDEYQLQQKSQRLQDGTDGTEWKPSGGTIADTECSRHRIRCVSGSAWAAGR